MTSRKENEADHLDGEHRHPLMSVVQDIEREGCGYCERRGARDRRKSLKLRRRNEEIQAEIRAEETDAELKARAEKRLTALEAALV